SNLKKNEEVQELQFIVNFTVVYEKNDRARIAFYPALVRTDYNLNIKSLNWIKLQEQGTTYRLIPYDFQLNKESFYCQAINFEPDYYSDKDTYYPLFETKRTANQYNTVGVDSAHYIDIRNLGIKEYLDLKYESLEDRYLLFNSRPIIYDIK